MANKKTSEQLQLWLKLRLEEAVLVAKQAELQSQQSLVLHREQQHGGDVSRVQIGRRSSPHGALQQQGLFRSHSLPQQRASRVQSPSTQSEDKRCHFCGLHTHERLKCPARQAKCFGRSKLGHWASVCKAGGR
ncbi:hypothetical protein PR048_028956 [Dryococelus australis]|uniref:Uncharacterized protein n=1 Tax=Dryococelus australis TaxID=614101 RepID=A0ABQ9GC08_9NEOP|nr:hypothetical protein PR048_028956 [Dryococelus australis]